MRRATQPKGLVRVGCAGYDAHQNPGAPELRSDLDALTPAAHARYAAHLDQSSSLVARRQRLESCKACA